MGIATEAIDRLHSTAHSHHRIIVCEVMGHNAGWLALGAGIAGGADVILIPEIPYRAEKIAEAILRRSQSGKRFSIVAVSEGARSVEDAAVLNEAMVAVEAARGKEEKANAETRLLAVQQEQLNSTMRLAAQLEALTDLESRVTILGYVQRGGTPSAADRLLATRLGTAAAQLINDGVYGVMAAACGDSIQPVPLEEVVGRRRCVPLDHAWVDSARRVGTALGD